MRLFKRTLTTAVAVCLALQSAVVCFGAEAEEQIPAGGEEVGLYTSENDEAIQLTEDMYSSWYEGDQTYDGTEKTLYGYNGDLTAREVGSVGGQMVKKMIDAYKTAGNK